MNHLMTVSTDFYSVGINIKKRVFFSDVFDFMIFFRNEMMKSKFSFSVTQFTISYFKTLFNQYFLKLIKKLE